MQTDPEARKAISPEVFAHVERLIDLPASQRAAALALLERDAAELYERVAALLQAADDAEEYGFLGESRDALEAGDHLGKYQLERLLGQGGMGQVWRARRTDGAYTAPVALKILHDHLARGAFRERFAREGRILGALSHVHIGRLLDAGVSKNGVSYLVLEHIDGERIDHYCNTRGLDIRGRIAVFLQICDAVAYAHAHMVVHRDLKPSNILVTQDGVVKLLDFGIAKLLTSELEPAQGADITRIGERMLTPDYAAPEQVRGETVTSATDVYSLGVLLFELLSGGKPYRPRGSTTVDLEHEILNTAPIIPSQASSRAVVLDGRAANPRELRRQLRGDLDAIVAKAMAKEPGQRYSGASALADDLNRYLRHEPVSARRLAAGYVLGRFVRRHWLTVSAAAAVFLTLLIGLAGVAWQAQVARTEARKAEAVKNFLLSIFEHNSAANPDIDKARHTTAQELLDISSTKMLDGLRDQPEVRQELLGMYTELYDELELYDKAEPLARARVADLSAHGDSPELAEAKLRLGRNLHMHDEDEDAVRQLRDALAIMDRIGDVDSANRAQTLMELGRIGYHSLPASDPEPKKQLAAAAAIYEKCCIHNPDRYYVLQMFARVAERDGQYADAERLYGRFLALAQLPEFRLSNPDSEGAAYDDLGSFLLSRHRYAEAVLNLRKAVEILSRTIGPDSADAAIATENLGLALIATGLPDEGDALVVTAVATLERSQGMDSLAWTVPIRSAAVIVKLARGDLAGADELLAKNRRSLGFQDPSAIEKCIWICVPVLGLSAELAEIRGELSVAADYLEKCRRLERRLNATNRETYGRNSVMLAALHRLQNRGSDAIPLLDSVVRQWPRGADSLPEPYVLAQLEWIKLQMDQDSDGATARAQELLAQILGLPHHEHFADWEAQAQRLVGVALLKEGHAADAETHLRRAVDLRQHFDVASSPWLAEARVDLSDALLAQDRPQEVGGLLAAAKNAYLTQALLGSPHARRLDIAWQAWKARCGTCRE